MFEIITRIVEIRPCLLARLRLSYFSKVEFKVKSLTFSF